jgi:hypothetical protein
MSSRFEQRRSRAGDAVPPITLVHPTRTESRANNDSTNEERPWQFLVRKLRQWIALEDGPSDGFDTKGAEEKPTLRLLPGGRLDEPDDERRTTAVTRGKWH